MGAIGTEVRIRRASSQARPERSASDSALVPGLLEVTAKADINKLHQAPILLGSILSKQRAWEWTLQQVLLNQKAEHQACCPGGQTEAVAHLRLLRWERWKPLTA
jgi:hypothetical protein